MRAVSAVVGFVRRRTFVVGTAFALLVLAALIGGRSATHASGSSALSGASVNLAPSSPSRATPGGGSPTGNPLTRVKVARTGHRPKATRRTRPRELHLTWAHGKVFDVRKLKSVVVRRERPERPAPGIFESEFNPRTARAPVAQAGGLPQKVDPTGIAADAAAAPAPDSSFDGLDFANWGAGHPPDTNGDVGPTYYIETVNTSIGIYDKSTGNRVAAFTFNSFMSQGHFGNLCDTNNFGDPVVLYDTYEDRWFITDFAFQLDGGGNVVNPPGAFQCFAVSKTGDPVNGGWNFYSIAAPGALNDYPKFGVWPDGIYMSANLFGYPAGGAFQGFHMWALNKQQMYAGAPSPQVVEFSGDTSDFTVIPANSRLQAGTPPAGSPEYFVSTEQFLNAVSVYKFHVDWDKVSTSTFTGPSTAATPTCWPNSAVANASTPANSADTLSIRAMAQAQYTNLGGAESLWVDHTVNRGEFPLASCGGTNTNNATVRWYQANVTGGTVAANVVQDASFDPDGANTFFRFMPALAVDRAGDLAVTYTKSNSTTNPQIKYAGRLASDPLNTFGQAEQTLIDGTGAQSGNCGGAACVRWGDYSGMSLDPNGCEFWMAGEYFATTGLNDLTRIGSFHYPGCTTVGNGTLSGTVTAGGNPVSGATVSLGNRTTTTNGSGSYSFTVPAGTYATETAAKAGFDTASTATIAVPDGGTATRNFALNAAAQSGCFTDNSQSTFQRGVPANCDLVTSPGNVILTNQPTGDQQATSNSGSGFNITTTQWIGQTFVPAVSGQLAKIDMSLFCASCSGTDQPLTVEVRTTSSNLPTSTVLASATIPGFSSGASGNYTATFASPPTLTAGTKYAFILRLATARTGNYDAIFSTGPTAYTSGDLVASVNSGASWLIPTTGGTARDMVFKTYMATGFASSGTLVSSLKDANPAPGSTPKWTTLSFTAATPAGTAVKFQIAGSNSQYGPFTFVGPDGTANTFFTSSGASLTPQFDGFRYLKYKAFLSTTSGSVTPSLSSVQVCFQDVAATSATNLTVFSAAGTFGGTTTLSATLTSGGNPVSGKTVSFTLNGSSAGSALTDGSGTATESGVSLAGINAGSYPTGVGASFAGDASFDPSSGSNSLTVSKADQAITVTTHAPATAVFNTSFGVAATGGGSGNPVTLSSAGACSNTGSTFTMTSGTGTCSVKYDQAGNSNYNAAPQVTESVTAQKADQAITVTTHAPATASFNQMFTVAATGGGSGNPVTFSSAGACSNTGATFTITSGTGTCSVKYDQAGDANYNAAPQVTESVSVGKTDQTITVTTHAPASAVFNSQFTVAATGGGSGNPVTFSSSGACSNTGATFTMTSGSGTCTVKYDQAGDANYNAAPQVTESVTAQKADQTITVGTHAPGTAAFNSQFTVAATAPGGAVGYSNSGSCSNSGATFTITSGSGTCTVKYDQGGNANYNPAPQVTESVNAQKADQAINISLHAPVSATFNAQFSVAATGGGSGNPVTFSSDGVCSNSGGTFTMTSGTGTCTVKYDQAGDANYNAAPQLTESVTAQKAGQTIDFAPLADKTYGDPDFTVSATASSGLTVSFAASGQCTVSGTTVHLTGPGSCTITASQAGDSNYGAAPDVPRTFQINSAETVSQITATAATCSQFAGGSAQTLASSEYIAKNGTIKKVIPNTIVYWVKVSLASGSQSVEVDQAITSGNFSQKLSFANGSHVYTGACGKVKGPSFAAGPNGSATASFNAPTAGTYIVALRFKVSAVNGQSVPTPSTVHYAFSTAGVSGSTSGFDLVNQSATSAPSLLRAYLSSLLR
jgi:hypothetical protein